jgi:hypothetical protein
MICVQRYVIFSFHANDSKEFCKKNARTVMYGRFLFMYVFDSSIDT